MLRLHQLEGNKCNLLMSVFFFTFCNIGCFTLFCGWSAVDKANDHSCHQKDSKKKLSYKWQSDIMYYISRISKHITRHITRMCHSTAHTGVSDSPAHKKMWFYFLKVSGAHLLLPQITGINISVLNEVLEIQWMKAMTRHFETQV